MFILKDEIGKLLVGLKSGSDEEILEAAVKLRQGVEQVVELPQKQVAAILRALLEVLDSGSHSSATIRGIYAAVDEIIGKVSVKYQIMYPKDVTVTYEYVIDALERERFPG